MALTSITEFSRLARVSRQAMRKHARQGTLGPHAWRGPGNRWIIDEVPALAAFKRNRDLLRASPEVIERAAKLSPPPVDPDEAGICADHRAALARLVDACRTLGDEDRQLLDEALREHAVSLECPRWDLHFSRSTPNTKGSQS